MYKTPREPTVTRPATCPECHGKIIDTHATVISEKTLWRCRSCEHTWTIASLAPRPINNR
jgi:ribosomal protein L37AE/L43A